MLVCTIWGFRFDYGIPAYVCVYLALLIFDLVNGILELEVNPEWLNKF